VFISINLALFHQLISNKNKNKELILLNINDVTISMARYKIERLLITCTGTSNYQIQTMYISDVIIQKEFDDRYFPLFTITINVPNWLATAMRKSTGNIKVFIDMKVGKFKNAALDIEEKASFTTFINDTYYGIIDDASPDLTEDTQIAVAKENESYKKGQAFGDAVKIKMLLYKESYLNGSRVISNAILSGCTLLDAAVYTLNKAGLNKVLVSPPNNNSSLSQFCITPFSAVDQLERICNEYAMHTKGTMIFFDLDRIYMIDKQPACNAYVANEYKLTYLASLNKSSGNSAQNYRGCYTNSKEKYHLIAVDTNTIQSVSNTDLNDKIFGNNFKIIDTKSGNITSGKGGSSKISGTSQYLISNTGGDTTSAISSSLSEETKVFTIGMSYVDLEMLTPNKQFMVTLDSATLQKYNGKVRLTKYICSFSQEGEYFVPNIVAEFKG